MTRVVGTALRGVDFGSPASEAFSARVASDNQLRIRIDAGGKITWGSGSVSGDTNLYRSDENILTTDDLFKATGGLVTITSNGVPTYDIPNGGLAVDTTNNVFYFRSDNTWNEVGGGNSVVTVSSSSPEAPEEGNLWFDIDVAVLYIYTTGEGWVSVSGSLTLDGLSDVTLTAPTSGQILTYNGAIWVNQNNSGALVDIDGGTSFTEIYEAELTNMVEAIYDGGVF